MMIVNEKNKKYLFLTLAIIVFLFLFSLYTPLTSHKIKTLFYSKPGEEALRYSISIPKVPWYLKIGATNTISRVYDIGFNSQEMIATGEYLLKRATGETEERKYYIWIWNLNNGKRIKSFYIGSSFAGRTFYLSDDGSISIFSRQIKEIKDLELTTRPFILNGNHTVHSISPDNQYMVGSFSDVGTLKAGTWDLRTGKLLYILNINSDEKGIAFDISKDSQFIVSCDSKSTDLWNLQTGEHLQTIADHGGVDISFIGDGKFVILKPQENLTEILNLKTGEVVWKSENNWNRSYALIYDNQFLLEADDRGNRTPKMNIFNLKSKQLVKTLEVEGKISISPNEKILVTYTSKEVNVWDLEAILDG